MENKMQRVEDRLFVEFVEALNGDLATLGATVRIDHRAPPGHRFTLIDQNGRRLGELPDQADAATIFAFEIILHSERRN
ncbi:hypothetical protein M0208_06285 [Sphingomonas sp. SUN019]|uniref:hypothetical protein n=1 Tax=Sphingomonas sp. SUN019 TaxID=2937788 RepID=UPI0021648DB0|nr:hypothetical protein [Sphingomonas sp. SUN019]UVO50145.1 hypothetical protein M0208_06285 [Sphingomonas sp. SUN019]